MKNGLTIFAITLFAVAASWLIFSLPFVSATNVNVLYNGQVQATSSIATETLVNKQVSITHDPKDVGWASVRVKVSVSSASLSKSIQKIYVYRCKNLDPVDCVKTAPDSFDTYVDTEFAWADMSGPAGTGPYPQVANVLILTKLVNGKTVWSGSWDRIVRSQHNIFTVYNYQVDELNLTAKSLDLVPAIKTYIDSYQMVPFNWVSSAILSSVTNMYGLGGSAADIDRAPPALKSSKPSGNSVMAIGNEFQFIFGNTTSGITSPINFNLNPPFKIGDNKCDIDLGESSAISCYDCGCAATQYCDVTNQATKQGSCRDSTAITLTATPDTGSTITDCSSKPSLNITAAISNPPSTLAATLNGVANISGTLYRAACTESAPGTYSCPVQNMQQPPAGCGSGAYTLSAPNSLSISLSYTDGAKAATQTMASSFGGVTLNYNCACGTGQFCEATATSKTCKSEASVQLLINSVTSSLRPFTNGNPANITFTIANPPSGMSISNVEADFGNLSSTGQDYGSVDGILVSSSVNSYNYSFAISVPGYSDASQYAIRSNKLNVSISWTDAFGIVKTKELSTPFADIVIPAIKCGDRICDAKETSGANYCCVDCGTTPTCTIATNAYCDPGDIGTAGCKNTDNLKAGAVTVSPDPQKMTDCQAQHVLNITIPLTAGTNVLVPSTTLSSATFSTTEGPKGWPLECKESFGTYKCALTIPPGEGCSAGVEHIGSLYYTINGATIALALSIPNGTSTFSRTITAAVPDMRIDEVMHCGNGIAETLGEIETKANCCIDVPCDAGQYCDWDPTANKNGACKAIDNVKLVIDDPKETTNLDSCEISQSLNITAHIENPPSGAVLESQFAVLNGTSTQYLACAQQKEEGSVYKCAVRIPTIWNCSEGQDYTWGRADKPNMLSFRISWPDGNTGKRSVKTINDTYGNVQVHQGVRTLYNIMADAKIRFQSRMDRIFDLTNKLADQMERCLKLVEYTLYAAIALIALSIIGGIVGGIAAGAGTTATTTTAGGVATTISGTGAKVAAGAAVGSQIVGLGAVLGSTLLTTVTGLCRMYNDQYTAQIMLQQTYLAADQMRVCTEISQHKLDTGQCREQESTCFSESVACITQGFSQIQKGVTDTNNVFASTANTGNQIAGAWNNVGTAATRLGGTYNSIGAGAGASFQVDCGGRVMLPGGDDCPLYGGSGTYPNCNKVPVRLRGSCASGITPLYQSDSKRIATPTTADVMGVGKHELSVCCDANKNGVCDEGEAVGTEISMTVTACPLEKPCCTEQSPYSWLSASDACPGILAGGKDVITQKQITGYMNKAEFDKTSGGTTCTIPENTKVKISNTQPVKKGDTIYWVISNIFAEKAAETGQCANGAFVPEKDSSGCLFQNIAPTTAAATTGGTTGGAGGITIQTQGGTTLTTIVTSTKTKAVQQTSDVIQGCFNAVKSGGECCRLDTSKLTDDIFKIDVLTYYDALPAPKSVPGTVDIVDFQITKNNGDVCISYDTDTKQVKVEQPPAGTCPVTLRPLTESCPTGSVTLGV